MVKHPSELMLRRKTAPRRRGGRAPVLSKTAEQYIRLYRNLDDPFVVADMRGRITGFNAAFRNMVGYSAAELRTLTYKDLTPQKWHALEADIVRRQILPRGHSAVYEKEYRRKNGMVFPVELRTFLIRDVNGQPLEMWAIVRDITARKRVEAALRMSQFALEQLSLPTFWVAKDASIIYVNKAACLSLGYSREELLSMKIMDIDPGFSRHRWVRHWRAESQRRSRILETTHRAKDGRVFPVEITISVFTVDGRKYHCDFVRDITDRKRVEAERREAHRVLDEKVKERTTELNATIRALRNAAHYRKRIERTLRHHQQQLRTLVSELAVAEGQERQRIATGIHDDISQMLAAAKLKTGQLGKRVGPRSQSHRLVTELERILNQVLDTSRSLTFDLASPVLHRIGLDAALEDLCDRMRLTSSMEFTFHSDRKPKQVDTAIQELVFQAVKELLRNVISHAHARQAKVTLTRPSSTLRITVIDDGIGFSEASLKGFRPTGGFGLHAIRERIHYLGGQFSIRRLAPRGSAVILTVPLAHQAPDLP